MARQQRFLQDLRQQAMSWNNLMFRLPGLVSALFKNVATTLTSDDVLRLAYWGVKLDAGRIKQVVMTGTTPTIAGQDVVVISPSALRTYVTDFLTPPDAGAEARPQRPHPLFCFGRLLHLKHGRCSGTPVAVTPETMPNASEWKALATMVPYQLEGPGYVPLDFKYSDRMPQKGGTYDIVPGDAEQTGPAHDLSLRARGDKVRSLPGDHGDHLDGRAHRQQRRGGHEWWRHLHPGGRRPEHRPYLVEAGRRPLLHLEHPHLHREQG